MHLEPSQNQDVITVDHCPICGSADLHPLQTRSDGVMVLQCAQCKMGFVERYPADLSIFYRDAYYAASEADHVAHGYDTYASVATHSLTWLIYYIRSQRQDGNVLDVGCANGYLLEGLGPGFQLYGIEANAAMAEVCRSKGITIIESDVNAPQLPLQYTATFDVITGIAVLEHVADMRTALSQIKAMLAPDGVFIFEVPLISETQDNGIWFRSSLEHIYYPTVAGLKYVFEAVFGLPLIGSEIVVPHYGPLFMGMIGGSEQTHARLATTYHTLFENPINMLQDQSARTVRFLFDVVHAAHTDPEAVALLPHIDPAIFSPLLLERLGKLWERDSKAYETLQQGVVAEQRAWIAELQAANAWHADQERLREQELAAQADLIAKQQTYMAELETAKTYLAQQCVSLEAAIERQQAWTQEVEAARDYQIQQAQNWQAVAEQQQIEHQALITWTKSLETERDYHAALAEERASWITQLEAARDYHQGQSATWEQQAQQQYAALQEEQHFWHEMPWYRRLRWLLRPHSVHAPHTERANSEVLDA